MTEGGGLRAGPMKSRPSVPVTGERDVRLAGGSFRLRALFLEPTLLGSDDRVLVEVESLTRRLPPARAVERRWGLTPRQAGVALLLDDGASNREVAEALAISPHTVRSHTDAMAHRLEVHTRNCAGAPLLVERYPPPVSERKTASDYPPIRRVSPAAGPQRPGLVGDAAGERAGQLSPPPG